MTYQGITQAWKPAIETTPIIREHKQNLDLIWHGSTTYSVADTEKMIEAMQLAVATQKRRASMLKPVNEINQLAEASATPL